MLVSIVPREVSFIMAAKSVRRPVIGHIAKMINVVPVERPQDLAKNGKGKILAIKNSILKVLNFVFYLKKGFKGEGTLFTKDFKIGDSITLQAVKTKNT